MEVWAQSYDKRVQFLCICVESLSVARSFHQLLRFQNAVNAYIPGRDYMPVGYGQLGCSGFVVVDKNGCFVSRRTKSFLTFGESAFLDVERLLVDQLNSLETPTSSPGDTMLLHPKYPYLLGSRAVLNGLRNQPNLNGQTIVIVGFRANLGRFEVELDCTDENAPVRRLAVLPRSLTPISTNIEKIQHVPNVRKTQNVEADEIITAESLLGLPSVGVACMDEEHEHCTEALRRLLGEPSVENFKVALLVLKNHFEHEEQLLKSYDFGGPSASAFSAFTSHVQDHERIIALGESCLVNEVTDIPPITSSC